MNGFNVKWGLTTSGIDDEVFRQIDNMTQRVSDNQVIYILPYFAIISPLADNRKKGEVVYFSHWIASSVKNI